MRQIVLFLFILLAFSSFAQSYPFMEDFVNGAVILKDSSSKSGQVKWFPSQDQKLKFRETEKGKTIKYSPEEVAGFTVDTFKFSSVSNFEAYAGDYTLLGKTSHIKHTFGQVLGTGKFNVYLVMILGYNAISGGMQTYPNFLFQNSRDSSLAPVAYPVAIRMKDKKYERAKEDLYILFKEYPAIVDKLKKYRQEDNFFEIINMVKAVNLE